MEAQTAAQAERHLKQLANKALAQRCARFFKTGPGQYGENDTFYGIRVPDIRSIAESFYTMSLKEVETLLHSPIHEARLLSLLILVYQFEQGDKKIQDTLFRFYKEHARQINNWDLVDLSAPKIVGTYLLYRSRAILFRLAKSPNLWERRISIVATLSFISKSDLHDTFAISASLLADQEDLIHKACGWMLREAGKKDVKQLERFLATHIQDMPRTMLRYAIEKFPETKRKAYLQR